MYTSSRFIFTEPSAAAEALLTVLEDARSTDKDYSFGSLSVDQVMASGLSLIGEIEEIADKLQTLDGTIRYDD
jgi:hypothetical protein